MGLIPLGAADQQQFCNIIRFMTPEAAQANGSLTGNARQWSEKYCSFDRMG